MHEVRTAILTGDVASSKRSGPRPEPCRRSRDRTLVDVPIPREERRKTNQRAEIRFNGVVDRATLLFRRKRSLVKVLNISGGGVMIQSGIMPRIGETVGLEFEGFERLEAVVRWVKRGRIGLDVGQGTIHFA